MKLRISQQSVIKILFLLSVSICIFDILGFEGIVSILYVLMFPLVIALTVFVLFNSIYRTIDLVVVVSLLIFAFVNSTIDILLSGQDGSLLDLKKFFIFFMTIAFLFACNNLQLEEKTKKFIEATIVVSSIIVTILYFVRYDEIYDYTNLGVKYLYFNFSNPNFASMYMLVFGMYNLILSSSYRKISLKILCFSLAIFMFFAVVETLSRNTILITIFFLAIFFCVKFKKTFSLRYSRAISALVSVWPLIFSTIYMLLINYSEQIGFLSFLDMNKGFDTRTGVWTSVYEKLSKSPIIGDFSFAAIRQSHNSHLDIWISYGFVTLILVCLFIFLIVYGEGKTYNNRISYIYMLGFICCCFIGMAEAALFAGCQGLFVLIGMYVLLSKSDNMVQPIIKS